MFRFRPGTYDQDIYNDVVLSNEDRIPDCLSEHDLIIDVGSHIGSFSSLVLEKGAGRVVAFEADRENYDLSKTNLKDYLQSGRVLLHHGAVWRSDDNEDTLYFPGYVEGNKALNTGGTTISFAPRGRVLKKYGLDEIIEAHCPDVNQSVKLLKIDCEGSEWPILMTSKMLSRIEYIVGEFHEFQERDDRFVHCRVQGVNRYNSAELIKFFKSRGFVATARHTYLSEDLPYTGVGLFFAARKC